MAKIYHDGEWYEQLSTEALYEEEYERLLVEHGAALFPNYRLVKFKRTVYSDTGSAKADFALIHTRYREWWVVEAELSHHSLEGHVRPQIETLSRALYGEDDAMYLHTEDNALEAARLCSMVKGQQPGVLVVVNAPVPKWTIALKQCGALITILEVFRSRFNKHLYRLNGEQPIDTGVQNSLCTVALARMLKLASPGILPNAHGENLTIHFRGGVTEWGRFDIQDGVYLVSSKPISLNFKLRYELVEREDGSFALNEFK